MHVIKDELDHFEEKFAKNNIDFLVKKSDPDPGFGSGTIIPDPTWPKRKKSRTRPDLDPYHCIQE
jgi:hypothetical protein